jgi:hypothetical protein
MIGTSLRDLYKTREGKRGRISSYDRTGGNKDYLEVLPGQTIDICNINGSGCITHIWMTMAPIEQSELYLYRKVVLRMFWDGEENPSVQAPIGDLFGMGHGITKNFWSAPLAMSPENGKALNSFFAMPFGSSARIQVESNAEKAIKLYFYFDYESYSRDIDSPLRFHAIWHREITKGIEDNISNTLFEFSGKNTTGEQNYVLLDAIGRGHYVGCNLNIHNLRATREWNWYGEGDDMIFIDGEPWPPSLHGTGMEDYFNTAWCPQEEYCSPYHGLILGGGPNWSGKISTYRFHIEDPVMFEKSLKMTIEHGHNNHRSDDYSSTAYWYQTEPHKDHPLILPVDLRLPLPDILPFDPDDLKKCFGH